MAIEQAQARLAQQCQCGWERRADIGFDRDLLMWLHDASDTHAAAADLHAGVVALLVAEHLASAGNDDIQRVWIDDP